MDEDISVHFAKSKPVVAKKVISKRQSVDPKKNAIVKPPPLFSSTSTTTPTPLDLVVADVQRKVFPTKTVLMRQEITSSQTVSSNGSAETSVSITSENPVASVPIIEATATKTTTAAAAASIPQSFSRRNPNRQAPAYTPAVISLPHKEISEAAEPRLIEHDMDEVEDATTKFSSPQDAFGSLGLDARLVSKITAPASSSSSSGTNTSFDTFGNNGQQHHVSSSSGIARGHLRDGFGLQAPTRVQRGMIPLALSGRSLVVKSETGSGKSLAFLLPIVQGLLKDVYPSSNNSNGAGGDMNRKRGEGGTRALIISPTRELCAQLFAVLTRLLQPFPLLVPCLLAGGEKRKSEKARLRKGCTIVIATPGRLLDHLRLTSSFVCSTETIQWLVLDEADRMLDMGFGQQVKDIMSCLKERGRMGLQTQSKIKDYDPDRRNDDDDDDDDDDDEYDYKRKVSGPRKHQLPVNQSRTTVTTTSQKVTVFLISATITPAVKELALSVLFTDAMFLDASSANLRRVAASAAATADALAKSPSTSALELLTAQQTAQTAAKAAAFSAPKQLRQSAMLVPLKWRLVTLFAVLVEAIKKARNSSRKQQISSSSSSSPPITPHCKVIVFLSTTDSVDFHYRLLSVLLPRALVKGGGSGLSGRENSRGLNIEDFSVSRLHGNVPQNERTSVFRAFSAASSGLMIATDVAARGLDLPAVDLIVQCDAPSEMQDYVHRIGRTARKGLAGSALLFLQPHESPYLTLLQASGLDVKLLETTPALSSLGDAIMPLELLNVHATKSTLTSSNAHPTSFQQQQSEEEFEDSASKSLKKGGKMSERDIEKAHFARLLSGSVGAAEAEAIAAASAMEADALKKRPMLSSGGGGGGGGGSGDRDNKNSNRSFKSSSASSHGGWAEEARDPESGVPLRLLSLVRRAKQVRNREGKGALISSTSYGVVTTASSSVGVFPDAMTLSRKGEEGTSSTTVSSPQGLVLSSAQEQAEAWAIAWQFFLEDVAMTGLPQGRSSSSHVDTSSSLVPLLPLARLAFMSFVRAYATHEKSVRHIFHTRALHLGHAAKAFALREQPKDVSKAAKDEARAEVDATNAAASAAASSSLSSSAKFQSSQSQPDRDNKRLYEDKDDEMLHEPERTRKAYNYQQPTVRTSAPSGPKRWAENAAKGSKKNDDSKKRPNEEATKDALGRPVKKIKRASALSEFDA
jgi:ATP-dependent RNA helicase DDX31/DBP7